MTLQPQPQPQPQPLTAASADAELVRRIAAHDVDAFEALMRHHNGALFRVARAIVENDADAEDVLQEAYLAAHRSLADFRGDATLSTWLTRIVINQSLARLRGRKRDRVVALFDDQDLGVRAAAERTADAQSVESAEAVAMRGQMRCLLERKIDALPLAFRTVFVMREVEEMTVDETAACLAVPPATVRTRLFRARALLRESLAEEMDIATGGVFSFGGAHCNRIVAAVLRRLRESGSLVQPPDGG